MIKKISWDDLYVRSYVTFNESRGDPLLGMFTQMDPLAEKYYGISPYAY